jgi:hypothetical protein
MTFVRLLTVLLVTLSGACAGAPLAAVHPVRVLDSEAAPAPVPQLVGESATKAPSVEPGPRIGAPGGTGAGSRRVAPLQSGNETVGGLPAGGVGAAGRG